MLSGCSGGRGGLISSLKPPAGNDLDKSSSNNAKGLTGVSGSGPTGAPSTMSFEESDALTGGGEGTTGFVGAETNGERDATSGD